MRVTVRRTEERLEARPCRRDAARRRRRSRRGEPVGPPDNGLVRVESPMVGMFYRAPQPGREPFVEVGDAVAIGQTLCILEAMKLMNEVKVGARGGRSRRSTSRTPSRSSSASSCSSSSRSTAARSTPSSRPGRVRAHPHRQPRRDRRPRRSRLPRARDRDGRRLLDRRPRRASRTTRRPRGLHRPAARRRRAT